MTVGDQVRKLRREKGWSQAKLAAEVAKRGGKLSQQNVANIESGIVKEPKSLLWLADALQVPPAWLVVHAPPGAGKTGNRPDVVVRDSNSRQVWQLEYKRRPVSPPRSAPKDYEALADWLMVNVYDPIDMPEGSAEDRAVTTLNRYLRTKARR